MLKSDNFATDHVTVRGPAWARVRVDFIQEVVAVHFGFNKEDLLIRKREANLVLARDVAIYLSRTLTAKSLSHLGRLFGGRHHTTILGGIRKVS